MVYTWSSFINISGCPLGPQKSHGLKRKLMWGHFIFCTVGDVLTNLISCFVVVRCAPFLDITFNTLKCCLSSQPQEEIAPTCMSNLRQCSMMMMRLSLLWKLSKRRWRRRRTTHIKSHKRKIFHRSKYQFLARNDQVPSWGEKYFILLHTNFSYLGFARNDQAPSWGKKYFIPSKY